nr:DUF3786 domain-containing protein [Oscillospiraceae bacterium]
MSRPDNYAIQARQAKDLFLTYDQQKLIHKFRMQHDEMYLYLPMLSQLHRIHRTTGDMARLTEAGWVDANSHGEVMTLLDLICDSREDRVTSGRWKNMGSFGLLFHRSLLENPRDPWADRFEADPEGFRRACLALGGEPFPNGDIAYSMELFDGLRILVQLWFGDEEFPASLRLLWDENALMYIKYETMWFAKGMLLNRIAEYM